MIADSIPSSGWAFSTYESLARYGTNYYGLRNRIAILSEAFSHDPMARRVASTYDFVSEILSYLAEHKTEIMKLSRDGDAKVAAWAKNPGSSPQLSLKSRMDTTRIEDVRVEADQADHRQHVKREPGMGMRQRTGIIKLVTHASDGELHADAHEHAAVRLRVRCEDGEALLPILKMHGIAVDQLDAPATVTAQAFAVDTVIERGRSETSRMLKDVGGNWNEPASRTLAAGARTSSAPDSHMASRRSTCSSPRAKTGSRNGASSTTSSTARADFPVLRITKPATFRSHAVRD